MYKARFGKILGILFFVALFLLPHSVANATGRSWMVTNSGSAIYTSTAMSADGTKIMTGANPGGITTTQLRFSADSGVTWQSVGPLKKWSYLAMSADGLTVVGLAGNVSGDSSVYVGTYSGGTWNFSTKSNTGTVTNLGSAAVSADGTKIIVQDIQSNIFVTANGGTTWGSFGQPTGFTSSNVLLTGITSDGSKFAVSDQQGNNIYTYAYNGGTYSALASWTKTNQTTTSGNAYIGLALSSGGTKLAATDSNSGKIYTGNLSGSTLSSWTQQAGVPAGFWGVGLNVSTAPPGPDIAISSDGTTIVAVDDVGSGQPAGGYIYLSTDSGVNWVQQTNAGARDWSSVSMSADGSLIMAVSGNMGASTAGPAWISTSTPTVTVQAASSISTTGATLNGNITAVGAAYDTTRGFVYGLTTAYGATTTEIGSFGTGAFTAIVSGLTCGTTYNVASYATTSAGISFSPNTTFTTSACPVVAQTVTTPPPSLGYMPGGTSAANQQSNLRAIYAYNHMTCPKDLCPDEKASAVSPVSASSFKADLYLGFSGDDVRSLQQYLNSHGHVISTTGAGSVGHESTYFGQKTKVALMKFQAEHGIIPASGYFGPKTRNYITR